MSGQTICDGCQQFVSRHPEKAARHDTCNREDLQRERLQRDAERYALAALRSQAEVAERLEHRRAANDAVLRGDVIR